MQPAILCYYGNMQTTQKLEEVLTLSCATTPVSNLEFWNEYYGEIGMSYPISGDILTIYREAHTIQEPELAAQIVQARQEMPIGELQCVALGIGNVFCGA